MLGTRDTEREPTGVWGSSWWQYSVKTGAMQCVLQVQLCTESCRLGRCFTWYVEVPERRWHWEGREKGWHSMLEKWQFKLGNDVNTEILESHCTWPYIKLTFYMSSECGPKFSFYILLGQSLKPKISPLARLGVSMIPLLWHFFSIAWNLPSFSKTTFRRKPRNPETQNVRLRAMACYSNSKRAHLCSKILMKCPAPLWEPRCIHTG